jgi:hypothetical protein
MTGVRNKVRANYYSICFKHVSDAVFISILVNTRGQIEDRREWFLIEDELLGESLR